MFLTRGWPAGKYVVNDDTCWVMPSFCAHAVSCAGCTRWTGALMMRWPATIARPTASRSIPVPSCEGTTETALALLTEKVASTGGCSKAVTIGPSAVPSFAESIVRFSWPPAASVPSMLATWAGVSVTCWPFVFTVNEPVNSARAFAAAASTACLPTFGTTGPTGSTNGWLRFARSRYCCISVWAAARCKPVPVFGSTATTCVP